MDNYVRVNWLIVGYALRYALGRQTFAPSEVAEAINENILYFHKNVLLKFCTDIEDALQEGRAGAECDVATWKGLLYAIEDELRRRERINE